MFKSLDFVEFVRKWQRRLGSFDKKILKNLFKLKQNAVLTRIVRSLNIYFYGEEIENVLLGLWALKNIGKPKLLKKKLIEFQNKFIF